MAGDAGRRMHTGLRTKLGAALAEDMIEVLAPLERGELAEKADIARLEGMIARLEGHIDVQIAKLLYVLVPIMVGLVGLVFAVAFAVARST